MRARELKAREIRKTGRIPIEFEAAEIEDIQN
jgi:hypothetical protein